ncbi:MAG: flavodoxin domain-containing protein [Candidatus Neomarinimicrobiota bacterium]|jgi:menaquinone-dependent protoporphyrinogen oxidase|nr:flavodoxin domain-containing protein [Candidatus Neomarinimicrobiota bacterium]MDD3965634.1 flavodoxin domain-containing protein [Candidatus Neomarinimicrobiota bacterium]MDX9779782.1 flavodoxin domain-containing protein [bacterium]
MKKLLIAYYTETNTTKEIAEAIGRIAAEKEWECDIKALSDISSVKAYDAVLVGAPVHAMRWVPEANAFVEKHRETLQKTPTAYYAVAYLLNCSRPFFQKLIRKSLDKACGIVTPVKTGMFDGRVESEFPAFPRWIFGVKPGTAPDLRDWEAVEKWTKALFDILDK